MSTEIRPRRIRPGTRYADFYNYEKNTFQEHCQQNLGIHQYIEQNSREFALSAPENTISPPENADYDAILWKYEQVRYFCKELNWLVVRLQGYCSPKKYPQMIATEQWIFLCAAHKNPKECFAIDYMRHTLDFVGNQLNDSKKFPSRKTIKEGSISKLGNICRRVYRVFAHAYYQHKKVYDQFEKETKLCQRFTLFCLRYNLIQDEKLFIVPCDGAPEYATNAARDEMEKRAKQREEQNLARGGNQQNSGETNQPEPFALQQINKRIDNINISESNNKTNSETNDTFDDKNASGDNGGSNIGKNDVENGPEESNTVILNSEEKEEHV